MKIIGKECIFAPGSLTKTCHASTLVKLGDKIICAWFGGERGSLPDTAIYFAVRKKREWSVPQKLEKTEETAHWNPVLFFDGEKIILYYKVGAHTWDWQNRCRISFDGESWSEERKLGENQFVGPDKNKPIRLSDGKILAPSSSENEKYIGTGIYMDETYEGFSFLRRKIPFSDGLIQPTVWEEKNGIVHAFMRSARGFIYRSDSSDYGLNWTRPVPTELPNNNSGIDGIGDGNRFYLCYNPFSDNGRKNIRTPLVLSEMSADGRRILETVVLEDLRGEYSYPAVINNDKNIFVSFTYDRKSIAFCKILKEN